MPTPLLVFLGFAAYAVLHSALLSEGGRLLLEAVFGPRAFSGLFRLGFSLQAGLLLGVYVVWVAGLPDSVWWRATGGWVWILWGIRLTALGYILRCVGQFGAAEFLGWSQFRAWWRGEAPAGDGIETGELVIAGPYRLVRHPMYAALFVALWAEPEWSENRVAFSAAASLYLWLGSLHEERRLLNFYGEAYRDYMELTPRFLPRLRNRR